jgi:hypothetical protein
MKIGQFLLDYIEYIIGIIPKNRVSEKRGDFFLS